MTSKEFPTTAFIGVGTMMEAMVDKAIAGGWPKASLILTHRREDRRAELAGRFGTSVESDNLVAIRAADMIILGVRPQDMSEMLASLRDAFRPDQTLVSIAAGLTVEWLAQRIPQGMTIVRVTPPPTAWISAGVTLISTGSTLDARDKAMIERLVTATCERIEWVPDELMEPITGVALAVTPYTCAVVKTLIETGIEQGCEPDFIRRMIIEGLYATARMLHGGLGGSAEDGIAPEQVIEMVATREGLTWSSLHTMEAYGVFRGIRAGARAMTGRSYELRGETVPNEYMGFHR